MSNTGSIDDGAQGALTPPESVPGNNSPAPPSPAPTGTTTPPATDMGGGDDVAQLRAQLAQARSQLAESRAQQANPDTRRTNVNNAPRVYTVQPEDLQDVPHGDVFKVLADRVGEFFADHKRGPVKVDANTLAGLNQDTLQAEAQARGFGGAQYQYTVRDEQGNETTKSTHLVFPGTQLVVE